MARFSQGKDIEQHQQHQQEDDHLTKDLGLVAVPKVVQNNPELWDSLLAAFKHALEVIVYDLSPFLK